MSFPALITLGESGNTTPDSFQAQTPYPGSVPTPPIHCPQVADSITPYKDLAQPSTHLYPVLAPYVHLPSIELFKSSSAPSKPPRRRDADLGARIVRNSFVQRFTTVDHISKLDMRSLCTASANLENFEPWHPEKEHSINTCVRDIAQYVYEQHKQKSLDKLIKCMNEAIGEVFATSLPEETKELLEVSLRTAFAKHLIDHQKRVSLDHFTRNQSLPALDTVITSIYEFSSRNRYYLPPPILCNSRAALLSDIEKVLLNEISEKIATAVAGMELPAQRNKWKEAIEEIFVKYQIPLDDSANAIEMQLSIRAQILQEKMFPVYVGECRAELLRSGFLPASFNDMIEHFHNFASMENSYGIAASTRDNFLISCFGDDLQPTINQLSESRIDRLRSLNTSVDFPTHQTSFTEDDESLRLWNHAQTLCWVNNVLHPLHHAPSALPMAIEEQLAARRNAQITKDVPIDPSKLASLVDAFKLMLLPQAAAPITPVITPPDPKKEPKKKLYTELALRNFDFSVERFDRAMPPRLHMWTYQNINKKKMGPVEERLEALFQKILFIHIYPDSEIRDAIIKRIQNEISGNATLTLSGKKQRASEIVEEYYTSYKLPELRKKIQDEFGSDDRFLQYFYEHAISEDVKIDSWDSQWAEYQIRDEIVQNLDRAIQALQRYVMEA